MTCYGPPFDGDRPRDSLKCVRCYHLRVSCIGGTKGITPDTKTAVPVLRSKRSADVAMDVDAPGPSKVAKSARLTTVGSLQASSSLGSLPPSSSPSIDFSALVPRQAPHPRPLRIIASVPSLPVVTPSLPASSPDISLPPQAALVDPSEGLLRSIRVVRHRVNIFAAGIYQELDDIEDQVREFRTHQ